MMTMTYNHSMKPKFYFWVGPETESLYKILDEDIATERKRHTLAVKCKKKMEKVIDGDKDPFEWSEQDHGILDYTILLLEEDYPLLKTKQNKVKEIDREIGRRESNWLPRDAADEREVAALKEERKQATELKTLMLFKGQTDRTTAGRNELLRRLCLLRNKVQQRHVEREERERERERDWQVGEL